MGSNADECRRKVSGMSIMANQSSQYSGATFRWMMVPAGSSKMVVVVAAGGPKEWC